MEGRRGTLWVLEDDPPATRPRWWCHWDGQSAPGFDNVDDAVAWGVARARSVVVRTLGSAFFYAGERPSEDDVGKDLRPWPPSDAERNSIDAEYSAIEAENIRKRSIFTIVGNEWERIARDLRATAGMELRLVFHHHPEQECWPADSTWWEVEVALDGAAIGSFGRGLSGEAEEFVAELADLLREFALDEEVGGGWPICPDHGTHPLEAALSDDGVATWFCPRGRQVAAIGSLPSNA